MDHQALRGVRLTSLEGRAACFCVVGGGGGRTTGRMRGGLRLFLRRVLSVVDRE